MTKISPTQTSTPVDQSQTTRISYFKLNMDITRDVIAGKYSQNPHIATAQKVARAAVFPVLLIAILEVIKNVGLVIANLGIAVANSLSGAYASCKNRKFTVLNPTNPPAPDGPKSGQGPSAPTSPSGQTNFNAQPTYALLPNAANGVLPTNNTIIPSVPVIVPVQSTQIANNSIVQPQLNPVVQPPVVDPIAPSVPEQILSSANVNAAPQSPKAALIPSQVAVDLAADQTPSLAPSPTPTPLEVNPLVNQIITRTLSIEQHEFKIEQGTASQSVQPSTTQFASMPIIDDALTLIEAQENLVLTRPLYVNIDSSDESTPAASEQSPTTPRSPLHVDTDSSGRSTPVAAELQSPKSPVSQLHVDIELPGHSTPVAEQQSPTTPVAEEQVNTDLPGPALNQTPIALQGEQLSETEVQALFSNTNIQPSHVEAEQSNQTPVENEQSQMSIADFTGRVLSENFINSIKPFLNNASEQTPVESAEIAPSQSEPVENEQPQTPVTQSSEQTGLSQEQKEQMELLLRTVVVPAFLTSMVNNDPIVQTNAVDSQDLPVAELPAQSADQPEQIQQAIQSPAEPLASDLEPLVMATPDQPEIEEPAEENTGLSTDFQNLAAIRFQEAQQQSQPAAPMGAWANRAGVESLKNNLPNMAAAIVIQSEQAIQSPVEPLASDVQPLVVTTPDQSDIEESAEENTELLSNLQKLATIRSEEEQQQSQPVAHMGAWANQARVKSLTDNLPNLPFDETFAEAVFKLNVMREHSNEESDAYDVSEEYKSDTSQQNLDEIIPNEEENDANLSKTPSSVASSAPNSPTASGSVTPTQEPKPESDVLNEVDLENELTQLGQEIEGQELPQNLSTIQEEEPEEFEAKVNEQFQQTAQQAAQLTDNFSSTVESPDSPVSVSAEPEEMPEELKLEETEDDDLGAQQTTAAPATTSSRFWSFFGRGK